jgi:hypothetical protein
MVREIPVAVLDPCPSAGPVAIKNEIRRTELETAHPTRSWTQLFEQHKHPIQNILAS